MKEKYDWVWERQVDDLVTVKINDYENRCYDTKQSVRIESHCMAITIRSNLENSACAIIKITLNQGIDENCNCINIIKNQLKPCGLQLTTDKKKQEKAKETEKEKDRNANIQHAQY